MCIITFDVYYRPVLSESLLGFGVLSGKLMDISFCCRLEKLTARSLHRSQTHGARLLSADSDRSDTIHRPRFHREQGKTPGRRPKTTPSRSFLSSFFFPARVELPCVVLWILRPGAGGKLQGSRAQSGDKGISLYKGFPFVRDFP